MYSGIYLSIFAHCLFGCEEYSSDRDADLNLSVRVLRVTTCMLVIYIHAEFHTSCRYCLLLSAAADVRHFSTILMHRMQANILYIYC